MPDMPLMQVVNLEERVKKLEDSMTATVHELTFNVLKNYTYGSAKFFRTKVIALEAEVRKLQTQVEFLDMTLESMQRREQAVEVVVCHDYSTWLLNRGANEIDLTFGEIYGYRMGTYVDMTIGGP